MTISSVINIVSATPAGTYSPHQNRISPASIEKYGSGVRRVIDSFVAYGLPEPTLEAAQGGLAVTVYKNQPQPESRPESQPKLDTSVWSKECPK